jgi:DNA helicase-2/ATP-dependent DNA helicase PcrA
VRIGALELADRLGLRPPTPQQVAIIEAPTAAALVVAGAGSGKTETMANRVVYLLANDLVETSGILGLTFTRKAAGELAERVRSRIDLLASKRIRERPFDPFDAPEISTYNSFANSLFRQHALAIGREGDATVLTDASAWQLARRIVVTSDDERLIELGKNVDQITEAVLALSTAIAENVVEVEDVARFVRDFDALAELPVGNNRVKERYSSLTDALAAVDALPVLLDLATAYAAEKERRGLVEYSDQVALALRVAEDVPGVVTDIRERYPIVLLDEYQDTSVVQTRLLSTLFRDHAVMAVGDPHQSIYGWRGASAANLGRFSEDFTGDPARADRFALSTSWRNPASVLAAANRIVRPLVAESPIEVDILHPKDGAGEGEFRVEVAQTVTEEARGIAGWFQSQLRMPGPDGRERTAALLCRTLKTVGPFTEALTELDVPFHVLGVGGLLEQPVIADLVSALRVLHDPTADPELVRLLTGARWMIGPRDIAELNEVAYWLAEVDFAQQPLDPDTAKRLRHSVVVGESRSLVDALDFVASAKPEHTRLSGFTDVALERMRSAGGQLAELRRRTNLHLADFVTLVMQELLLDIEVAANESSTLGQGSIDGFFEQLGNYLSLDVEGDLGGFLAWLTEAEKRENLAPRSDPAEEGVVQILTIHGSKGLEWDSVAIPRMVDEELPSAPRSKKGWLEFGTLPNDFRGDVRELPALDWRGSSTQEEFDTAYKRFQADVERRHADEQRRLGYVAITRARQALLLSASFWWTQKDPRAPGLFLRELEAEGLLAHPLPTGPEDDVNPLAELHATRDWPLDPLGKRGPAVRAAAQAVRQAAPSTAGVWAELIDALIEERRADDEASAFVDLPSRVSASRFKDFVSDPAAMARDLRRPLPERPYRATRIGTAFHAWVEHRLGVSGSSETIDAAPSELEVVDDSLDLDELARLQQIFERSEFAPRRPTAVELELHLLLDGQIIVCKIDAVYEVDGRYQIVDWKTGKAPSGAADLEAKQFQLALYRQAFADWMEIEAQTIDAVFYYVSDDEIIRPDRIYSRDELVDLWRAVAVAR